MDNNPSQSEGLFQPRQLRAHGTIDDETASWHRGVDGHCGRQMTKVGDVTLPLYFDAWKTFLSICRPTDEDLDALTHDGVS